MKYECIRADYGNPEHGSAVISLLNGYACDKMGGGTPLADDVKLKLIPSLKNTASAISILCYQKQQAIGLINAFEGFSTFAAAPLINVHDVYIAPEHRGRGVLELMFEEIDLVAKERQCCKITLEVLSKNHVAKSAYRKLGFEGYELLDESGEALFWQKKL